MDLNQMLIFILKNRNMVKANRGKAFLNFKIKIH